MTTDKRITDLNAGAPTIRRHRYGMIEIVDGQFQGIQLRRWPQLFQAAELMWINAWLQRRRWRDSCRLFYDQPRRFKNFLVLKYIRSSPLASFQSIRRALLVLDQVARIKRSDALLCHVRNRRISDRLMRRCGWERHVRHSRHRHYIKRFYGTYPVPEVARELLNLPAAEEQTAMPSNPMAVELPALRQTENPVA